jgi:hypothetical protein
MSRRFSTNRRTLLKGGLTAIGAGVMGRELATQSAIAKDGRAEDDLTDDDSADVASPPTTPFVEKLPVYAPKQALSALSPPPAPVAMGNECGRLDHQRWASFLPKKVYELHVREAMHSFHRELPTQPIWGYDGILPGPTFVAKYHEPIVVRIYNDLPQDHIGFGSPEISTHLHNLHDGSESDGFTGDYYSPRCRVQGNSKTIFIRTAWRATTSFMKPRVTRAKHWAPCGITIIEWISPRLTFIRDWPDSTCCSMKSTQAMNTIAIQRH